MSKRRRWILLTVFFLVNCVLRIPGFFHELQPWTFCDEDLMIDYAYRMLRESSMKAPHFLSGGINFYIPIIVGKVAETMRGTALSPDDFRILARITTAGILSSATVFWIYGSIMALGGTWAAAVAALTIFTFSPMILGISRYHYPDHYMVFFVTAGIYAITKVSQIRRGDADARKCYLWAGLAVGLMCSVKYSGFLLYLLMGFASCLALITEILERKEKPHLVFARYVRLILYATLAAGLAFIATNPSIFRRWNDFKEGLMVKHYGPAESLLPGITFYTEVLFLTFFGVLGVLAFLWGIRELYRRNRLMTLTFLILPIGVPLFFSKYNLLYNRNILIAAPFVIILSGFGLEALVRNVWAQRGTRRLACALALLLFCAEPLYRSFYSYQRDFRPDSRLQAQDWIASTFQSSGRIARLGFESNSGCMYPKVIEVHNNPNACLNYVALDNWFGGLDSSGRLKTGRSFRNLLMEPDYKTYHFMAEPMLKVPALHQTLGSQHVLVRSFDGAGPKVFVFKDTSCEEVTDISRDEPRKSHSVQ